MPKLNNQYTNNKISTNAGNRYKVIYAKKLNEHTNEWEPYEKDIINQYELIQEASENCSLTEIIEKYNPQGLDTTKIPNNKIEKMNLKETNKIKIKELTENAKKQNDTRLSNDNKKETDTKQVLPK